MKVFISHAQSDAKWADLLRRGLKEEGVEAVDPSTDIFPGENWGLKYGRALEQADAMIVLISPASAKSEYVNREIAYALSSPRFRDRLIAVQVRPTADTPWILTKQSFIRATDDTEKLVRDVAHALKGSRAEAAK